MMRRSMRTTRPADTICVMASALSVASETRRDHLPQALQRLVDLHRRQDVVGGGLEEDDERGAGADAEHADRALVAREDDVAQRAEVEDLGAAIRRAREHG